MDRIDRTEDGELDDVFIHNPKSVHIERMGEDYVWMSVETEGKMYTFHFIVPALVWKMEVEKV